MEAKTAFMDKKLRNQLVITIIAGCLLTVLTGFITSYEVSSKKAIENNVILQNACDKNIEQDKKLDEKASTKMVIEVRNEIKEDLKEMKSDIKELLKRK